MLEKHGHAVRDRRRGAGHWHPRHQQAADRADSPVTRAHRQRTGDTPGKQVAVDVNVEIDPTWHLYALTEPPGPIATSITLPKGQPFTLNGEIGELPPKKAFDPNFGVEPRSSTKKAPRSSLPIHIASDATGKQTLHVDVLYQTCNDRMCLPPTTQKLTLELTMGKDGAGARSATSTGDAR